MIRITLDNYSNYTHFATRVQFVPVEDKRTGLFVAIATVTDEAKAEQVLANPLFRVVEDEEWTAINTLPERVESGDSETGDPLSDAAQAADKAAKVKANKAAKNAPVTPATPATPASPTDTKTEDSDGPPPPPVGA